MAGVNAGVGVEKGLGAVVGIVVTTAVGVGIWEEAEVALTTKWEEEVNKIDGTITRIIKSFR